MYNARDMSQRHKSQKKFSRRQVLGAAAALGAGAFLVGGSSGIRSSRAAALTNHHLAWVWQFSTDSEPDDIGAKLRDHGLGIILKTHDGVTWMSEYDTSPYAVSGPDQVKVLADYFEEAGVPFHAWCVVHGSRPEKEAQMAAGVALSGARSVYLDIEPHAGFWRGTAEDAKTFGTELRRLAPDANIILSIDPRPWVIDETPIREFAAFSNAIAPQNYWRTFDTKANYDKFEKSGYPVPDGGVTPEFLLAVGQSQLMRFGLPLIEVGQGDTKDPAEWERFIDAAYATGVDFVTAWRYGVMPNSVFSVLRDKPAKQPPIAPALANYVVESGDTLGTIAATYGTSVDEIMALNGLSDPNYLFVGQELQIPGAGVAQTQVVASAQPVSNASGGGGQVHTVQSGDTLFGIAGQYGADVSAIVNANGISDPNYLFVGQELHIP
jgi:LysM repeat protein